MKLEAERLFLWLQFALSGTNIALFIGSTYILYVQVVDEYDEESEIAEKFRIKVWNFPQTPRCRTFCW